MCIIIYAPDGHIPKKHLANSLNRNRDGWGVMWPEDGEVQIVQGLTRSDFFRHWKWIKRLKCPKVFHARIGTHGTNMLANCHPFHIPHHNLAVAHNGMIGRMGFEGDKSDTRHFVERVLAWLPPGFERLEVYQELMCGYIGHSKLAFMDGEGDVTIINDELGVWVENRWYSNDSYKGWSNPKATIASVQDVRDWLKKHKGCQVAPVQPLATKQLESHNLAKLPEHYKPKEEVVATATQQPTLKFLEPTKCRFGWYENMAVKPNHNV